MSNYPKTRKPKVDPKLIEKACSDCGITKPINQFHWANGAHTHRRTDCDVCKCEKQKARQRELKASPKYRARRRYITMKHKYGLTEEQVEALPRQCEICGSDWRLCVDHDRQCCPSQTKICGKCIRGVL